MTKYDLFVYAFVCWFYCTNIFSRAYAYENMTSSTKRQYFQSRKFHVKIIYVHWSTLRSEPARNTCCKTTINRSVFSKYVFAICFRPPRVYHYCCLVQPEFRLPRFSERVWRARSVGFFGRIFFLDEHLSRFIPPLICVRLCTFNRNPFSRDVLRTRSLRFVRIGSDRFELCAAACSQKKVRDAKPFELSPRFKNVSYVPCNAYLLDLESVANPTLSRTPHLGMLIKWSVSSSKWPSKTQTTWLMNVVMNYSAINNNTSKQQRQLIRVVGRTS